MMSFDDFCERTKSQAAARIGLAVLALLAAAAVAAPMVSLLRGQEGEIADSLQRLARLRAEAATAPALTAQLKDLRRRTAALPGFIQANSASLAQAQLQQAMETLVKASGASIRSAQMLPVAPAKGFQTISIQYDLTVPMSRLRDLTYAVESHAPYLFLTDAQIAGAQAWQQAGNAQDPSLSVRWTVIGYRWSAP